MKRKAFFIASGSATSDVRILKEAESIQRSGRSTLIFHFPEKNETPVSKQTLGPNLIAIPWRQRCLSWLMAAMMIAVVGLALTLALFAATGPVTAISSLIMLPVLLLLGAELSFGNVFSRLKITRNTDAKWTPKNIWLALTHRVKTHALNAAITKQGGHFILHAHEPTALAMAAIIKKKYNAPLIYDAHELYEDMAGVTREQMNGARNIHTLYLSYTDQIITVSDGISKYYKTTYELKQRPVTVSNAIPTTLVTAYDGRLHSATGLARAEQIIVYHGGFKPHRGLADIVSAMKFTDGWRLVLIGDGPIENDLRAKAADNITNKKIMFLPMLPHDELLDWLAGATLGLIPYEDNCLNHRYCAPNKLWELPAAGVPILARNLTNVGDILRQHRIGWTFPVDASPEHIASIIMAIDEQAILDAREACTIFSNKDSWHHYEQRLLSIYEHIDQN